MTTIPTILEDYRPTTAEEKLIVEIANPENLGKSITEIARKAGVTRQVYYLAVSKPGFQRAVDRLCAIVLKEKVKDVYHALSVSASKPNPANFQDRKLFLELAGKYLPQLQLNAGVASLSDDNLAALKEKLLKDFRDEDKLKITIVDGDSSASGTPTTSGVEDTALGSIEHLPDSP